MIIRFSRLPRATGARSLAHLLVFCQGIKSYLPRNCLSCYIPLVLTEHFLKFSPRAAPLTPASTYWRILVIPLVYGLFPPLSCSYVLFIILAAKRGSGALSRGNNCCPWGKGLCSVFQYNRSANLLGKVGHLCQPRGWDGGGVTEPTSTDLSFRCPHPMC